MVSLFWQVWLWSVLAFVLGVLLTWAFLVRPVSRRNRELTEELTEARARARSASAEAPASPATVKAAPAPAPEAPASGALVPDAPVSGAPTPGAPGARTASGTRYQEWGAEAEFDRPALVDDVLGQPDWANEPPSTPAGVTTMVPRNGGLSAGPDELDRPERPERTPSPADRLSGEPGRPSAEPDRPSGGRHGLIEDAPVAAGQERAGASATETTTVLGAIPAEAPAPPPSLGDESEPEVPVEQTTVLPVTSEELPDGPLSNESLSHEPRSATPRSATPRSATPLSDVPPARPTVPESAPTAPPELPVLDAGTTTPLLEPAGRGPARTSGESLLEGVPDGGGAQPGRRWPDPNAPAADHTAEQDGRTRTPDSGSRSQPDWDEDDRGAGYRDGGHREGGLRAGPTGRATWDSGSRDSGSRDSGSRDSGSRDSGSRDGGSPGGGARHGGDLSEEPARDVSSRAGSLRDLADFWDDAERHVDRGGAQPDEAGSALWPDPSADQDRGQPPIAPESTHALNLPQPPLRPGPAQPPPGHRVPTQRPPATPESEARRSRSLFEPVVDPEPVRPKAMPPAAPPAPQPSAPQQGPAQQGPAHQGPVQPGSAPSGSAPSGSVQPGVGQPGAAQPGAAKPGAAKSTPPPARPRSAKATPAAAKATPAPAKPAPAPAERDAGQSLTGDQAGGQPFVPKLAPEAGRGERPELPQRRAGGNFPGGRTSKPAEPGRPAGADQSRSSSAGAGILPASGTPTRRRGSEFAPRAPFGPGSMLPKLDGAAPGPDFRVKATLTGRRYYTEDAAGFGETRADVWFRTVNDAERAGFRPAS